VESVREETPRGRVLWRLLSTETLEETLMSVATAGSGRIAAP
jgi:hypothetical protein